MRPDPLASSAVASQQRSLAGAPRSASGTQGPASFADWLSQNLSSVNDAQQRATRAQEDLVSGLRDDVDGVLIETQKADTAFRMLLAIRNKLVEAYQELQAIRV